MHKILYRAAALVLSAVLALPGALFGSIGDIASELARNADILWDFGITQDKDLGASGETQPSPEQQRPYFGQLHSHSAVSGGTGSPAQAYAAAREAGLDFFALTDHSHCLDGPEEPCLPEDAEALCETWRLGREAARDARSDSFLSLYGFELSWQNGLGHIGALFTPGFLSREQLTDPGSALEECYAALGSVPGALGMFNHPGSFYGDFQDFDHLSPEADSVMQLLEISCQGADSFSAYLRALEKGWHVAPVISGDTHGGELRDCRTAVWAGELTEEAFAAALAGRRVYATGDRNLQIDFTLAGSPMGSILHRQDLEDSVTLSASLLDPDGEPIGLVEVITAGGTVAGSLSVSQSSACPELTLDADLPWFFLRITQPDGDQAVTAPVWIEQQPALEISLDAGSTAPATAGQPLPLQVQIRNRHPGELTVEEMTFRLDGQVLQTLTEPVTLPGCSRRSVQTELTVPEAGPAELTVTVRCRWGSRSAEATDRLSLTVVPAELVPTLVIAGSPETLPGLTALEALAAGQGAALLTAPELTGDILDRAHILLITPGNRTRQELQLLADYCASGRPMILCGGADDAFPRAAEELNVLAQALGLTARFREDTAWDPVSNGGRLDELYTDVYNEEDPFSAALPAPWVQHRGCTVDPGMGSWLVKGLDTCFSVDGDGDGDGAREETFTHCPDGTDVTCSLVALAEQTVLLAREDSPLGGSVYLCGGFFAADGVLDPGGASPWDTPNGNAAMVLALLEALPEEVPLVCISQARTAAPGQTLRIRGHLTAGTAEPDNRFPGMLYLQDDTGGLGIAAGALPRLSTGTAVELYLLRQEDSFRLLQLRQLSQSSYLYPPLELDCGDAMRYELYPELLIRTEGRVVCRTLTSDGRGLSAFTLEGRDGSRASFRIEDTVRSGTTGENTLAETVTPDSWVRAAGILCLSGEEPVLRVRDCDEVTSVRETGITYRVVRGEYTLWIREEGKSIYIELEAPGEEFLGIWEDGMAVSPSCYQTTVTPEGNLLFRLWPRYLKTLSLGRHSLEFRFRSGSAQAVLLVRDRADSPYTADPIPVYGAMMILSGGLLLLRKRRR